MEIEFDDEARKEYDDAIDWYLKRSPRAARNFVDEVGAAIRRIVANPQQFARTFADCQISRVKSYPYVVVFYQTAEKLVIVAVAHAKRRSGYWQGRLP
jgi:plasmid stabilization system protein ParE